MSIFPFFGAITDSSMVTVSTIISGLRARSDSPCSLLLAELL